MKLLLLLISITLLSTSASTCNKSGTAESTATTPDSLATTRDTMTIDTAVTAGNPQTPSSTTTIDSLSKEEKAQSASGKNEAPQHNSPNQEKVDSIKASKKKKH